MIPSHAIHRFLRETKDQPDIPKDWSQQDFLRNQKNYRSSDPLPYIALNTILTCILGIVLIAHILWSRG